MRGLPPSVWTASLLVAVVAVPGCANSPAERKAARQAVPAPPRTRVARQADSRGNPPGRGRGRPRKTFPLRVYVPENKTGRVTVINPRTYRIIRRLKVAALPQHVTPSYDMRRLWVNNNQGNSLIPIDPRSGRAGRPRPVDDPYNLYFTPDGRDAIVVAERLQRLDFRDPLTMRLRRSVPTACPGINHMDFTPDGRLAVVSCEFSGQFAVVDVRRRRLVRRVPLRPGAMPQDVRLSPDGRTFYLADMATGGTWQVDARNQRVRRFVRTGRGAHGLAPSADRRLLYVSNRGEGSISVLGFNSGRILRKWRLPGGGSPDMGGVTPDGRVLWLSGRYNSEVYAISTRSGRLLRRIPVGGGPHGLAVFPERGGYSLGHNGLMRPGPAPGRAGASPRPRQ